MIRKIARAYGAEVFFRLREDEKDLVHSDKRADFS